MICLNENVVKPQYDAKVFSIVLYITETKANSRNDVRFGSCLQLHLIAQFGIIFDHQVRFRSKFKLKIHKKYPAVPN